MKSRVKAVVPVLAREGGVLVLKLPGMKVDAARAVAAEREALAARGWAKMRKRTIAALPVR
jgi:hypothetical protein